MPEERLQRARYALLIDSFLKTFLKNVPIESVLSDVMVFTLLLSRFPDIAEILVTMLDPEMTSTFREPPPRKVITSNEFDRLACEGLMTHVSYIELREPTPAQREIRIKNK